MTHTSGRNRRVHTHPFALDQVLPQTRNVLDLLVLVRMPCELSILIDQVVQVLFGRSIDPSEVIDSLLQRRVLARERREDVQLTRQSVGPISSA